MPSSTLCEQMTLWLTNYRKKMDSSVNRSPAGWGTIAFLISGVRCKIIIPFCICRSEYITIVFLKLGERELPIFQTYPESHKWCQGGRMLLHSLQLDSIRCFMVDMSISSWAASAAETKQALWREVKWVSLHQLWEYLSCFTSVMVWFLFLSKTLSSCFKSWRSSMVPALKDYKQDSLTKGVGICEYYGLIHWTFTDENFFFFPFWDDEHFTNFCFFIRNIPLIWS